MNDRELLEKAAKAAGIDGVYDHTYEAIIVRRDHDGIARAAWNPLTDDGDALRLAVELGMAVSVEHKVGSSLVLWGPPMGSVREPHGNDPAAATRRAIVRAAAALGEQHE